MSTSTMKELQMIAALDRNLVIGQEGAIPWHHPKDLRRFRRITTNHAVIMGRGTYDSMGRKALSKRHNFVVTRAADLQAPGCFVAHSLGDALARAYTLDRMPFIIGGQQLYGEAMPMATLLHLTLVPGEHAGDRYFPNYLDTFREVARESEDELVYLTLRRNGWPWPLPEAPSSALLRQ